MTVVTDTEINGQVSLKTLKAEGVARKKPSEKLLSAISSLGKEAAGYFKKLEGRVNEVLDLGRKEGFTDLQIGDWIRAETKEHYSKMTIARLLPPTAKHMEKARFGNKMLPNSSLGRTVEGVKNDGISSSPSSNEIKIPPTTYTIQDAEVVPEQPTTASGASIPKTDKPGPGEIKGEWSIGPAYYELKHLAEYDTKTHIGIIKYLDKIIKNTDPEVITFQDKILLSFSSVVNLQNENEALKKENAALKKENGEYKRLPNNDWLYNRIDVLQKENKRLKEQLGDRYQFSRTRKGLVT